MLISEDGQSLLRELHLRSVPAAHIGERDQQLVALAGLARLGEAATAAAIPSALIDAGAAVLPHGLRVITELLARAEPDAVRQIIAFAQGHRLDVPVTAGQRWWDLDPQDIARIARTGPAAAGFLAAASGHHSGHVREAAVRALAGSTASCVLPALRDRLNDWVGPVRSAAQGAMRPFLSAERAGDLVRSLGLLVELERCGRDDHRPLLDQVRAVLKQPAARDHLRRGLDAPDAATRRHAFMIYLDADAASSEAIDLGLACRDPWIRQQAARTVESLPQSRDIAPFLARMARDPSRPIRQLTIEILARRHEAASAPMLERFLLDRNGSVREYAHYYLRKFDPTHAIGAFYRVALQAGGEGLKPAIAGLGEVGMASDAALISRFLADPRAMVRRAACRSLDRLLPLADMQPFADLLTDASARVRAAAVAALDRR